MSYLTTLATAASVPVSATGVSSSLEFGLSTSTLAPDLRSNPETVRPAYPMRYPTLAVGTNTTRSSCWEGAAAKADEELDGGSGGRMRGGSMQRSMVATTAPRH